MKKIIFIFLFLVGTTTYSQNNERPISSIMIETSPVYKGCETQKSQSNKTACSKKLLMKHIDDNFDTSVSVKTNLPAGQYNIYTSFVIDKDGNITDIKTKGNDYEPFVKEAKRLISSIPKYVAPGIHRGKTVRVSYVLPIAFIVEIENK